MYCQMKLQARPPWCDMISKVELSLDESVPRHHVLSSQVVKTHLQCVTTEGRLVQNLIGELGLTVVQRKHVRQTNQ
jgi:hypothetical protein